MWLYVPTTECDCERDTITIADLCAGTGMLGHAVEAALEVRGVRARTVVHVEREAVAAAALVGIDQAAVRQAPVWDDLATFDGRRWRGAVDCLCAGLPCPAYSTAGKRIGNSDARAFGENFDPASPDTWGPVPHFLRIVDEMRPDWLVLENVPPWVAAGHFRPVRAALRGLGYRCQRPFFATAEAVGASHRRERVFILADRRGDGWRLHQPVGGQDRRTVAGRPGEELALGAVNRQSQYERRARPGTEPDAPHGEPQLALGPERGCGAGEQSPGGDGQPDRGRGQLADGDSRRRRAQGDDRQPTKSVDTCGVELGDSERARTGNGDGRIEGDSARHGRDRPQDAGAVVGDGRHVQPAGVREEPGTGRGTIGPDARCNDVVDSERDGLRTARDGDERPVERGGDRLPLHAPARNDWRAWELVARLDPSRMPAIESGVSVVADGLAIANSDILRLGGNGVDSLEAATAVGLLLDRRTDSAAGQDLWTFIRGGQ